MSRVDDPYDNATAESLWSRLKAELDMPKAGYDRPKRKYWRFQTIQASYHWPALLIYGVRYLAE